MSLYRRFVAEFSGLNKIPATSASTPFSPTLDSIYQLKPTDYYSKGRVVVATTSPSATDRLSSEELHVRTQKALDGIRQLRRWIFLMGIGENVTADYLIQLLEE